MRNAPLYRAARAFLDNSKEKAYAVPEIDTNWVSTDKQARSFAIRTGLHDINIEPRDFWSSAEQRGDCWVWIGETFDNGYGKLRRYSRSEPTKRIATSAHRYSYYLAYKYEPGELYVCHHCDQRSCLRPDHLFLGTNLSNMHDISRKRRLVSGDMDMPPDLRLYAAMLHDREAARASPFAGSPRTYIFERGERQFMVNMKMHGARFSRTFPTLTEAQSWRDMVFRLLSAEADATKKTQWATVRPLLLGPNWSTECEN